MDALLEALGERIKLPGLRLDEDRAAAIDVDNGRFKVQFNERDDELILTSQVGRTEVRGEERRRLCEALLEANFGFQGTLGATLALEPDTGCILLQKVCDDGLDLDLFETFFSDFVYAADTWEQRLRTRSWEREWESLTRESETPSSAEHFLRMSV